MELLMKDNSIKINNIDEYISIFPHDVQMLLQEIRDTIKKIAPEASEVISYGMPAFKFHGILVYFAAYKNHIGFYPTGSGIEKFKHDLSPYKFSKGTIQFDLKKPIPYDLIAEITTFRKEENLTKLKSKKTKNN